MHMDFDNVQDIHSDKDSGKIKRLAVDVKGGSYDIHIGAGLLHTPEDYIPNKLEGRTVFVLSDRNVSGLYGDMVTASIEAQGATVYQLLVDGGEKSKSFSDFERLSNEMLAKKVTRDSVLIALGGGVVGDLGGFLASTIVRGISYIQMPTTLLAQVDSSVGGKTAINTQYGKNLVGTFYQPDSVIIDVDVLSTLPPREYMAGVAEVLKYGLIVDLEFFEYLEAHAPDIVKQDPYICEQMIYQSCAAKAAIVSMDEKETSGQRILLNLGHTFGHALELIAGYNGDVLHGEAVAVGMLMALDVSCKLGNVSEGDVARVRKLYANIGLPQTLDDLGLAFSDVETMVARIYELMLGDKKATRHGIKFVILSKIGQAVVNADLEEEFIKDTLRYFIQQ